MNIGTVYVFGTAAAGGTRLALSVWIRSTRILPDVFGYFGGQCGYAPHGPYEVSFLFACSLCPLFICTYIYFAGSYLHDRGETPAGAVSRADDLGAASRGV